MYQIDSAESRGTEWKKIRRACPGVRGITEAVDFGSDLIVTRASGRPRDRAGLA
jgi:hypothetical protein